VKRSGEYGVWERQKGDQHQEEDVQQQQGSLYADNVLEHAVVVVQIGPIPTKLIT
jgi:hypothetical protein